MSVPLLWQVIVMRTVYNPILDDGFVNPVCLVHKGVVPEGLVPCEVLNSECQSSMDAY